MRRPAIALCVVGLGFLAAGCGALGPRVGSQDAAEADFRRVADRIVAAVRDRDAEALLALSRPGLEDFDHVGMHPGQPLYCFVFDTSCIQWGRRSVYDLVTTARALRVRTRMLTREPETGRRVAIVELFDKAVVDEARLESEEYFCARWNVDVMTWTFEYDGRAWRSAHPIFDQYTDVYCPPEGPGPGSAGAARGVPRGLAGGSPSRSLRLDDVERCCALTCHSRGRPVK